MKKLSAIIMFFIALTTSCFGMKNPNWSFIKRHWEIEDGARDRVVKSNIEKEKLLVKRKTELSTKLKKLKFGKEAEAGIAKIIEGVGIQMGGGVR